MPIIYWKYFRINLFFDCVLNLLLRFLNIKRITNGATNKMKSLPTPVNLIKNSHNQPCKLKVKNITEKQEENTRREENQEVMDFLFSLYILGSSQK